MTSSVRDTVFESPLVLWPKSLTNTLHGSVSFVIRLSRFSPIAGIGGGVILVFLLTGIFAPLIATHDPNAINLKEKLAPPSSAHFFGTDDLGRDIFSRTVTGARISLTIGLVVVFIAGISGSIAGLMGGYLGGRIDRIIMRSADAFLAFPSLILAMALAAAMGPGIFSAIIAIAVTSWPKYARLVRSVVLGIKKVEYVLAARSIGAHPMRIIFRHIMPNSLAPVLVQATVDIGLVILLASGLSFIGFGVQPPTAEWGAMVSRGRNFLVTHWWVPTIPGLAILASVMGFNLFGDGLRDWMDPRLRE